MLCPAQENRSFDHYFGTLSAVDGFDTPTPLFQQGWNPETQAWTPPALRCPTAHQYRQKSQQGWRARHYRYQWIAAHLSWNGAAGGWHCADRSVANTPVIDTS